MGADTEHNWFCRECSARFDDPQWRDPKRDHTTTTAAAVLEAAGFENPEQIIRDA